jgi:hypothetical protein
MTDFATYLDYGSTEISDDLNPEPTREPEKQEPSNERRKFLADSLSTALEYGRRLAIEEGLYPHEGRWMHADIPDDDIILGANDWLLAENGFTYDEFVDGMESVGLSDGVEWAWSMQGEPTVQWNAAHMERQGNPWQMVWDVGGNALGAAGSLLKGDLGGARDAWTEKDGHMYGYDPNPYGSQIGNALGIHNWADAGFAFLDLADILSFGMGGMIIAPIRSAAAHAQMRMGNHEIARIIGGKRLREEFAERAAHGIRGEARREYDDLRTMWDALSTGEREVIEADYIAATGWVESTPRQIDDPVAGLVDDQIDKARIERLGGHPESADMMRWYEQQGLPGTPEGRFGRGEENRGRNGPGGEQQIVARHHCQVRLLPQQPQKRQRPPRGMGRACLSPPALYSVHGRRSSGDAASLVVGARS